MEKKCVICAKSDEKITVFREKTLQKYYEILKIRQKHRLKYKDIILPSNANLKEGYYRHCYKSFIALMKKYGDDNASGIQLVPHPVEIHLKMQRG